MGLSRDELLTHVFARAFRFWRRWDEALWRYLELSAVSRALESAPELLHGPILDLGCGPGDVFELLFGRRQDAFGVEPSATFGDDAEVAARSGIFREVRREDGRRMSFEDGRFSLVFSNSVLEHVAPVAPLLSEVCRVLRPGGAFLFTTPDPRLYSADAFYWRRALRPLGLDAVGRRLVRADARAYAHVSILPFSAWSDALKQAGFSRVERRGYMDERAARVMTRFGPLTRIRILHRFATTLSPEARKLRAAVSQTEWIERCSKVLANHLEEVVPDDGGCGQLIIARKAVPDGVRP